MGGLLVITVDDRAPSAEGGPQRLMSRRPRDRDMTTEHQAWPPRAGGCHSPGARASWAAGLAAALALLAAGCRGDKGGGELHAQQVVLEREVEGFRELAARLERGEAALPPEDVVVGISEVTVQEMVSAQLPFEVKADKFVVVMSRAEVAFKGSPGVTLHGSITVVDRPNLTGEVKAIGALEEIEVDPATGTLRAKVAVDHIGLLKMAGLEKLPRRGDGGRAGAQGAQAARRAHPADTDPREDRAGRRASLP